MHDRATKPFLKLTVASGGTRTAAGSPVGGTIAVTTALLVETLTVIAVVARTGAAVPLGGVGVASMAMRRARVVPVAAVVVCQAALVGVAGIVIGLTALVHPLGVIRGVSVGNRRQVFVARNASVLLVLVMVLVVLLLVLLMLSVRGCNLAAGVV